MSIFNLDYFALALSFFGSLIGTYFLIPIIIRVAKRNHLMDSPNDRSSHSHFTPRIGGIAFFINFVLGFYILRRFDMVINVSTILIPAVLILFVIGINDDLLSVTPRKKFMAQFLGAILISFHTEFHIHNLHGFLGIAEMSDFASIPLEVIGLVFLINAFNLIDGIDGLASTLSIIIFASYGAFFYYLQLYFYLGVCLIGMGTLLAFLRYNVSHQRSKKIFMGDSGSLTLGFMIGILTVKFLNLKPFSLHDLPIDAGKIPFIVLAILFIPVFDTLRVFLVRLSKGKSPFKADRIHIHHLLIDHLQLSHKKATFCIGIFQIIVILTTFFCLNQSKIFLWGLILSLIAVYFLATFILYRKLKN